MKTIFITGANRGIGHETAKTLAAQGNRVFLGTREIELNGQIAEGLENNATWVTIDVSKSASIHAAVAYLQNYQELSALDVLINNAGIYPDEGFTIETLPREQIEKTFGTNTFGALETAQAFLPLLRYSNEARIVNVSSGLGQWDSLTPNTPSYCLSKFALNGITKMMAEQLAADNISINSVCPGWVRTDMGGDDADRSVEEGAAGIVWLASEAPQTTSGRFFRDGKEIDW